MLSRIYRNINSLPIVKEGTLASVKDGAGISMLIFTDEGWKKYATALSYDMNNDLYMSRLEDKAPNGVFTKIELRKPGEKVGEVGSINGNITSAEGLFGDTCITLRAYSRIISGDAKQHIISNNTVATDSSTNKVAVGNTHAMAFDAGQNHHYKHISYIAPYNMRVNGVSAIWSDGAGTASGNNYLGIWTRPSGTTSTVAKTGTGTQEYTLKWVGNYDASSTALAAGESAQVSDNSLGTNAFDLNAGDWLILTNLNTTWSSTSSYIAAHVTLYCKVR